MKDANRHPRFGSVLLTALIVSASAVARIHACAVCFGEPGSDLSKGFYWGIVILLMLPFTLLGGLVGYIVYSTKKNKATPVSGR